MFPSVIVEGLTTVGNEMRPAEIVFLGRFFFPGMFG